jgi:uncharacterized LabA/DUF88 family protein
MKTVEKNFAFIDSQNLNLGIRYLGWKLSYKKFRVYLRETWGVEKAYVFIGYSKDQQELYRSLQESGYVLIFKPMLEYHDGTCKGNVDADLVLRAMIDFKDFEQAVIVTSDGDFYCLVDYLRENNKLATVLSPVREKCSKLLKHAAKEKIYFLDNLRNKLEYK